MNRTVTPKRREELKEAFSMFDKDGDGTISSSELKTVMKTAGLHPSDGDVTKLIKVSDGSNNVRSSMFDRSKPKIGCSSSITTR